MNLTVEPAVLTAFLLAMARSFGFVYFAQPFALPSIPRIVRVALGVAFGIAGGARMVHQVAVPSSTGSLVVGILLQGVEGALIGYLVNVFMNIGSSAGSSVGLFGGFSPPPSLDPLSLNQSPSTGQLYGLLWMTLFFVSGGATLVVGGLLNTFRVSTIFSTPELGFVIVVKSVSVLMGAAIQIAAPILAVLFLTQVIVGVLTKVAPQLNPFMFSFPLQILLSLALISLSLVLLPSFLGNAVQYMISAEHDLIGG